MKTGLLLIQLGTPDHCDVKSVKRYLRQFLMDPLVIQRPCLFRWLLVNMVIVPFRARRSAKAYASIWRPNGSPLRWHSENLVKEIKALLPKDMTVALAMRYGDSSIEAQLRKWQSEEIQRIFALPLYPQYALSTTQSSLNELKASLERLGYKVPVYILPHFYSESGFIRLMTDQLIKAKEKFDPDHILFSFHGLPQSHLRARAATSSLCGREPDCCLSLRADNEFCYQAHCYATMQAIAQQAGLLDGEYSLGFQSRLGREDWLKPFTSDVLMRLAEAGTKKVLVICPSFVADCLETIEEIGIREKNEFIRHGGEQLRLVPSLNDQVGWAKEIVSWIDLEKKSWTPLN